jgi:hypothetical protein
MKEVPAYRRDEYDKSNKFSEGMMYRDIQFFSLSGIRNYVPHQLAYFQDLKSKTLHLMASECKLAFI